MGWRRGRASGAVGRVVRHAAGSTGGPWAAALQHVSPRKDGACIAYTYGAEKGGGGAGVSGIHFANPRQKSTRGLGLVVPAKPLLPSWVFLSWLCGLVFARVMAMVIAMVTACHGHCHCHGLSCPLSRTL